MDLGKFYKQLAEKQVEPLFRNEPLQKYTTWKIGGPADLLYRPKNFIDCAEVLRLAKQFHVPVTFLGVGSNVLIADEGIRGLVIQTEGWREVSWSGQQVTAGSGILMSTLSRLTAEKGMSGLEFAAGIPGSLGGAVVMNAGAYGCSLAQVIAGVKTLDLAGELREYAPAELELGYRDSIFKKKKELIVETTLSLKPGNSDEIKEAMKEYLNTRRAKQPLDLPSAGSVFKNTAQGAGRLIEGVGAKGWRIGDAQVSEKHANFIVNRGEAKASEVLALIKEVQKAVKQEYQVELKTEVVLLGFEDTGR